MKKFCTVLALLLVAMLFVSIDVDTVRTALAERTLTEAAAQTPIEITDVEYPRLRGAVALVAAPTYALPRVA